ncbi:MAG TPA: zinc ribbon domain-containing protein [Candidatus Methanomethylophilaceae archaeon]|nr:zinc ribbon domain-containing protein [Candidatus Methanomethylophilaceae archaeon]
MRRCPYCGTEVPANSINCPGCYREIPRRIGGEKTKKEKDPRIALLLALLPGALGIWGLGHIYLGAGRRGLYFLGSGLILTLLLAALAYGWFLVITIVCLVLIALIWLAGFVMQALEAWMLAQAGSIDWESMF